MSEQQVKMVILSTDDLDESIRFYSETLGMSLKFRDGAHFAALDGGPVTLALATAVDHPIPGQVVVGIKTDDVDAAAKAVEDSGGGIVKGPYDDAHERRAVVYDNKGNGIVFSYAGDSVTGTTAKNNTSQGIVVPCASNLVGNTATGNPDGNIVPPPGSGCTRLNNNPAP